MLLTYFKTLPYWFPLVLLYLLIGGITALKPRLVWIPLSFFIPLALLGMQTSLIVGISHEFQLIALLCLLAGIALGGTVWRPIILRFIPGLKLEVAGEKMTLALVLTIFVLKTTFGVCGEIWATDLALWQGLSSFIGAFIPGVFLGRGFFLAFRLGGKK